MVWIHGGSNRYGSGEEYDGRILAEQGVVVVTINYRLGVIGFLSTEDDVAPGNYALLDEVLAISWVKRNIHYFGGDPQRLTIFGNSAGGSHCGLMLLSPLTKGLLAGAIPQSGSPASPWAIYRPPFSIRERTRALAEGLGCPTTSSHAMVACLRLQPADILSTISIQGTEFNSAFVPTIDGYFIKDTPENLLQQGQFHSEVALMTGTVPDEMTDEYDITPEVEKGISRQEKEERMNRWSQRFAGLADYVSSAISQEYDEPGDTWQRNRDLFFEMRADNGYVAPHDYHAKLHSSHQQHTFLYSFEYRSPNHPTPKWRGVQHMDEMYYILGVPFMGEYTCPWPCRNVVWYHRQNWTDQDRNVSRTMMRLWSDFAKHRTPVPDDSPLPVWQPFNVTTQAYYQVAGHRPSSTRHFYKYQRVGFWTRYLFPLLERLEMEQARCQSTPPPTVSGNSLPAHLSVTTIIIPIILMYIN